MRLIRTLCFSLLFEAAATFAATRPNVVVMITDDQGYGDIGFHGNPYVRTPEIDNLARQSVRLSRFYVSPVCSPTRASLLTGRYNYRTGVVDTYLGRSLMFGDEVTLAEILQSAGYRTGIFGKWHLGDNYPMRPVDQGFEEALVHRGGGIGQPSDPPGGESYFNPILQQNGRSVRRHGYCTDIFTDAALDFMRQHQREPFLIWLAFNAPHAPLEAPKSYLRRFPPGAANLSPDVRRIYAMISNLDDNIGRLLRQIERLTLTTNTVVIFLTDNGPQQPRYNCNLRGLKGSVYEGGIRVPFFVRWPGVLPPDRVVDQIAAHIDLTPTILDACGIKPPVQPEFDGRSLLPLMRGVAAELPRRTLFFQWHRGDEPQAYRSCAARTQRYKLVQNRPDSLPELFDIEQDPFEKHGLAGDLPDVRDALLKDYKRWFTDVTSTRHGDLPRIVIGSSHENPTILTRQDWTGPGAGWDENSLGHWRMEVVEDKPYRATVRFRKLTADATAHFGFGDVQWRREVRRGDTSVTFPEHPLPPGYGELHCWLETGAKSNGVNFVEIWSGIARGPSARFKPPAGRRRSQF